MQLSTSDLDEKTYPFLRYLSGRSLEENNYISLWFNIQWSKMETNQLLVWPVKVLNKSRNQNFQVLTNGSKLNLQNLGSICVCSFICHLIPSIHFKAILYGEAMQLNSKSEHGLLNYTIWVKTLALFLLSVWHGVNYLDPLGLSFLNSNLSIIMGSNSQIIMIIK